MNKWLKSAVSFLLVFWAMSVAAAQFPPIPHPFRYVNDYTQTLSTQAQQVLEQKLVQYSRETSSQIAVVIVPTVAEQDIAQYTFELGDKWGIGRKHLNNGILILVAKEDRKMFIATGQGLEGVLPDTVLSQLIRQQITPYFKQGMYAQGIDNGLNYLIAVSKGEFKPQQIEEEADWEKYMPLIMVVIFILFVLFSDRNPTYISPTNNHQMEQILRRQSTLSRGRYRSGGGGFGGFGGGSGGGFGGGSFGGGGAGGSW